MKKFKFLLNDIEEQSTRRLRACDNKQYLITDLQIIESKIKLAKQELNSINLTKVNPEITFDEFIDWYENNCDTGLTLNEVLCELNSNY